MTRKKILLSLVALALPLLTVSATDQKDETPTMYMVADAHFDTQWRWTVQTSIEEYLHNTLVQNFDLLDTYPDYKFSFEGAVKYAWAREYYPDLYERLKGYVASGRWHISGSSWDANDPNIPSIESSIRNILLGQEFYRHEFGVTSNDIMLPDCFGFGYTLPSIAAHCGLIGFHTQKLKWRTNPFYEDGRKFPFYFGTWRGIDGQRVMAVLDGGSYSWSPKEPVTDWPDFKMRLEKSTVPAAYRYFGTGDRGGSATPTGVRLINDAVHNPGPDYKLKFATTDEMLLDYLWDERLPEYDGELLMDVHATGNYTSKCEMKMLNRRNERMLGAAEGVSCMNDLYGGIKYPSYIIDEGWKRVLWHQFHDDLTGTSIAEAYQFSYNDEYLTLNQMGSVVESGVQSMSTILNTAVKGTPIVVYNHVTADNADVVSYELSLADRFKSVEVYAPNGRRVKSQIIGRKDGRATVLFAGVDPSLSLSVYDLRPSMRPERVSSNLKAGDNTIENKIYKVSLNAHGDICSIIDKRCGREMVAEGEAFAYAFFKDNKSDQWPSWEILKEVIDREPAAVVDDDVRISVEELGSLRAVLRVERSYEGSTFVQRIVLTDGAQDDRIDVVNTVDWGSKASLLKASFPMSFDAPEATYDLGMGSIRRGNNTATAYEVYAQQWADMTAPDDSYGVTIMNDSKYGWDKPNDHTLRLTLIHTPTADANRYSEQATQDLGEHTFTYSIVGHTGALDYGRTDIAADILNQDKLSFGAPRHTGVLGRSVSLLSSTNPDLRVKAFKKAQDGDGYILRVYELSGQGSKGQIIFNNAIVSAEEVNGIEDPLCEASFNGRALNVESSKYALKTFRVHLSDPQARITSPEYTPLELPMDIVGITTDAFTSQGRLGPERKSFAAEVMPSDFEFRGVPYEFGEPNYDDCLSCDGQSIAIPEGTKTLHLLVADTWKQEPFVADFKIGDTVQTRTISTFSGFYGSYGWPGYYGSWLRPDEVAYIGTHTHSSTKRNLVYEFTYMYHVSIPVEGADSIVLPSDKSLIVFAATAEK